MSFGDYLKQLRNQISISQRELADRSGISNAEISRIETGDRLKPSPEVLRAIAPILGVEYEELLDNAGYLSSKTTYIQEIKEENSQFIDIITPFLFKDGWSIERLIDTPTIGDIRAKKNNFEWILDYINIKTRDDDDRNIHEEKMIRDTISQIYGRLAVYNESKINKYTIMVSNKKAFSLITKIVPSLLNVIVSVMLLDFKHKQIDEEKQLN